MLLFFIGFLSAVEAIDVSASRSQVEINRTVMLSCCATGEFPGVDPPVYSWLRRAQLLPASAVGTDTHTMFLPNLTSAEFGDYACAATSGNDSSQSPYIYVGNSPASPTLGLISETIVGTEGATVSINCNASGVPMPSIHWHRYHSNIPSKVTDLTSPALQIPDFQQEDAGIYYCEVSNTEGTVDSHPIEISTGMDPAPPSVPVITKHAVDSDLAPGTSMMLTCCATGNPPPQYVWRKSGISDHISSLAVGVSSPSLIVPIADMGDGGTYECIAVNSGGMVSSSVNVTLSFEGPPYIEDFTQGPVVAEEGDSVSLYCLSKGFPKPNNTWSKVDGDLPEQTVLQSDGARLVFTDSSGEDAGTYVCTATNEHGSADQQYVVQVVPSTSPPTDTTTAPTPPQVVSPTNVTVEGKTALEEGTDLILNCSATGNPEPSYMWIRAGDRLPSKVVNPFSSQLVVPSVTWSDVGLYYCLAINTAGATQSLAVYVLLQAKQGSVISNREKESAEGLNMNLVGGIFGVIFSVVLLVSGVVGFVTCFTFGQNSYNATIWDVVIGKKKGKNIFDFVIKVEPMPSWRLTASSTSLTNSILQNMKVVRRINRPFESEAAEVESLVAEDTQLEEELETQPHTIVTLDTIPEGKTQSRE